MTRPGMPRATAGGLALAAAMAITGSAGLARAAVTRPVAPVSGPAPVRVTGLPRSALGLRSLSARVTVRNPGAHPAQPRLDAWLVGSGRSTATTLRGGRARIPAHHSKALTFTASVPRGLTPGPYRLEVCRAAAGHRPPHAGCARSATVKIIPAATIPIGHHPVTAAVTLATAAATTAVIDSSGGSLSATGPDGSRFALTIPANAIAGSEQVTLTPLTTLNAEGARLVAGVQIAPAGLVLFQPATLTITPAHPASAGNELGFGFAAGGAQFGLLGFTAGGSSQTGLLGFGGVGIAQATPGQRAAIVAHPPSDPVRALLHALAATRLSRAGKSAHATMTAGAADAGTSVSSLQSEAELVGFYQQVLVPELDSSITSLGTFQEALVNVLAFEHQTEILGLGDALTAQDGHARDVLFNVALPRIWNQALAKCDGGIDSFAGMLMVESIGRQAILVGAEDKLGGEAGIAAAITKCSNITLEADVSAPSVSWQGSTGFPATATQVAISLTNVPLTFKERLNNTQIEYASAKVVPTESLLGFTPNPSATQCGSVTFAGFKQDPTLTSMTVVAILTLPADLYTGPAPVSTLTVTLYGGDFGTFNVTCRTISNAYLESMGTALGVADATQAAPVQLTAAQPTGTFSGSGPDVAGGPTTGTYTASGTITVHLPGGP